MSGLSRHERDFFYKAPQGRKREKSYFLFKILNWLDTLDMLDGALFFKPLARPGAVRLGATVARWRVTKLAGECTGPPPSSQPRSPSSKHLVRKTLVPGKHWQVGAVPRSLVRGCSGSELICRPMSAFDPKRTFAPAHGDNIAYIWALVTLCTIV